MLLGDAQKIAFGAPGEPGNPDLIDHLAARITDLWRQQVDWASQLQATAYESARAREAILAVADIARQPIIDYRNFVDQYIANVNELQAAVARGESRSVKWELKLTVPDNVNRRVKKALQAFGSKYAWR